MVAAIPPPPSASSSATTTTAGASGFPNPQNPDFSSENNASASYRRPRFKDVTSRYLAFSSKSSSTSTTSTATSSSSTSSSRRYPSPLLTPRPAAQSPALSHPKRSQSVNRPRPSSPRPDLQRGHNAAPAEMSSAARALCTTTRSLSVSFQGESFFYQTSKAKAGSHSPARKPTPERKRASATTVMRNGRAGDQAENSGRADHHRWPAVARNNQANLLLTRSLDCSSDKKDPVSGAARLLQHSMLFEDGRRASFDADLSASSDTESVSSGSNSGAQECSVPVHTETMPHGNSLSARFWQETNGRMRRFPECSSTTLLSPLQRTLASQKLAPAKKSLVLSPMSSPRPASLLVPGSIRSPSPIRVVSSPSRAMSSPTRTRSASVSLASSPISSSGLAPSILCFAAEMRRAKKGENVIEEAHFLRLLHNQFLQWRFVNARVNATLLVQRLTAEKHIYSAWTTLSKIRESVMIKRMKLQLLTQNLKLTSILKGQMAYLEEWSCIEREHYSSLLGATEALKASTLRLPVVGGARVDIQALKETVSSAVDVMQAMGSSLYFLLSKVESVNSLMSELAKVIAQEEILLDQSRDILSKVAVTHVKQCSLRGHMLQLRCRTSTMPL